MGTTLSTAKRVLVTGATGFLGTSLLPQLEKRFGEVTIVVRKSSIARATKLYAANRNVRIVSGELYRSGILDEASDADSLGGITDLVHAAAHYDLAGGSEDAYLANVVGTQNVIDLAGSLRSLERFHHISTVAVSGDYEGVYLETMFNQGQHFRNAYARTKFRAEDLVRQADGDWIRKIYRLGIVIGDSQTGRISKIDGPYYFLKLLLRVRGIAALLGKTPFNRLPLPYLPGAELPLIPVDTATLALAEMISRPLRPEERVWAYHLSGTPVIAMEFLVSAMKAYRLNLQPLAVPSEYVPARLLSSLGIPGQTIEYMTTRCRYDRRGIQKDYPDLQFPAFSEYQGAFFDFAERTLALRWPGSGRGRDSAA